MIIRCTEILDRTVELMAQLKAVETQLKDPNLKKSIRLSLMRSKDHLTRKISDNTLKLKEIYSQPITLVEYEIKDNPSIHSLLVPGYSEQNVRLLFSLFFKDHKIINLKKIQ